MTDEMFEDKIKHMLEEEMSQRLNSSHKILMIVWPNNQATVDVKHVNKTCLLISQMCFWIRKFY